MTALPVAIIGAGFAGLACARRLRELEIPFVILEASNAVGGWLIGPYPVLVSSFPEVRRIFDQETLNLQPLTVSVFRNGTQQPFDFRLLNWLPLSGDDSTVTDQPAIDYLRWAGGFPEEIINAVFRPLAGVFFLERDLRTSARLFRFLSRHLRADSLSIPAGGMTVLAEQLLPGTVRFRSPVRRIDPGTVELDDDSRINVRGIVVATGGPEAHRLIGDDLPLPTMNGTTIVTFRTPIVGKPELILNGSGTGLANHVIRNGTTASAYIPDTSAKPDDEQNRIRTQMAEWFGTTAADWTWESTNFSPFAIPDMSVGVLTPWQRPVRLRPGHYVCGDHRDQATINGVLESGFRTAQAVAEDISERRM